MGHGEIESLPKYWRENIYSSKFYPCKNKEENCKGGYSVDFSCIKGHLGALCEDCDIYNKKL